MPGVTKVINPVDAAYFHVRKLTDFRPKIALVLGSGLGSFADSVTASFEIQTSQIPHYPVGSVQGHAGKLIFGIIEESGISSLPLLLFQGRVHYYEVGQIDKVVLPIELAQRLGATILVVTNAAGGINADFKAGQLMLIKEYLNLAGKYPSTPSNARPINLRSTGLDPKIQDLFRTSSRELKIGLQEGTYCWLHGPSYETAAEIRMLRTFGVDAVGMSTVPEIYRAASLGMRVGGVSLISNMATGISPTKLSHQEVTQTANKAHLSFSSLMRSVILRIR